MRRLIISDIHIGSKFYKAEQVKELIESIDYDQLILNGDILDLIKVPIFTDRALSLFKAIDPSKEIIYVVGNHDLSFRGFIGESMGPVKFVNSYEFSENDRTFRVEHGDTYDKGWVRDSFWIKLISLIQNSLENYFDVDLTSWYISRKIKKRKLKRIWDLLDANSDVDVIILGHTHIPEAVIWVNEKEEIKTYINCGDWVSHTSYVMIDNGVARLKEWNPKN